MIAMEILMIVIPITLSTKVHCEVKGMYEPMKLMIDAANDLAKNSDAFIQNVKTSMRGGSVRGENFDRVLV